MDGRNIYVGPWISPVVREVYSSRGDNAPLLASDNIIIHGSGFEKVNTVVRIGSVIISPSEKDIKPDRIKVDLAAAALAAGSYDLEVIRRIRLGDPPTWRNGPASRPLSIKIAPRINNPDYVQEPDKQLRMEVSPFPGRTQKIRIHLNEITDSGAKQPVSYCLKGPIPEEDASVYTLPAEEIVSGRYLIRLEIDGAISPLNMQDGKYAGPAVQID